MVSVWNLFLNIFGVIIASFIILLVFFKKKYNYWKNFGVVYLEPTIPFGNFRDNVRKKISIGEWCANFYSLMKSKNLKYAGCFFFLQPAFVPIDLDLVKQIMQVDFSHFTDHGGYVNEKDDPLSAHIFSLEGQRWRNLRMKLTPTFTSGKMKSMFPIMVKISQELIKVLEKESEKFQPVDAKDISARLTTDIIGNCAFGIECNSLQDPNTEFRVQGKRLFNLTGMERMSNFMSFLFPNAMKLLGVRLFPKVATTFFWNVIKDTTEYRTQNNIRRGDALQLLLDMVNKEGNDSDTTLTYSELAAQAFVFFIAGFETSSTLLSFALLELALNEDVQDKLREEVNMVLQRNNNEISYEALAEMKYLDMVINETLRKYPPLPLLTRVCTQDYRVPNTDIILQKGDSVFISNRGIHYDPEYYPDPHKFDPTRFSEENKSKRHQYAFLPFGEGPRICIGLRFGMMQVKVGLSTVIRNFKIKLNSQTKLPIKLEYGKFLTTVEGNLWVDFEKIN